MFSGNMNERKAVLFSKELLNMVFLSNMALLRSITSRFRSFIAVR